MSAETPAWHDIVVKVLKAHRIQLVTYVPDNVLAPLIRALHADPYFTVLAPARAYPGRHGAMLLPWKAALDALSKREAAG